MVNENLKPIIENKPFEIVQELKDEYKIPSYEEFVKGYENDGNLNYGDLSGGSVGEVKGYGPYDLDAQTKLLVSDIMPLIIVVVVDDINDGYAGVSKSEFGSALVGLNNLWKDKSPTVKRYVEKMIDKQLEEEGFDYE
ncbi:9532_t:CDS:2 [Racocetra persica]|uniref:9532_t:CDS:1 n=1 Tax=Racocetra persica TaxID=160502 RepID=A0ACA9S172_9GLOM|nr:9532_t:CDS:2 [Racocetra persica]